MHKNSNKQFKKFQVLMYTREKELQVSEWRERE